MAQWKPLPVALVATVVWAACAGSSEIERLMGNPGLDGVRVISVVVFSIVVLTMLTERGRWPVWKRIGFVPVAFVSHVILTIPASGALGVLMYTPDHVRSLGEQRGVFILAAIPVMVTAMWQSRLFVAEASEKVEEDQ